MVEFKNRVWVSPLVDLTLLVVALKAGFLLRPGERPELAMLGAAVLVQLFAGPRTERFVVNSLASAAVIFLLYMFYWQRGMDAWPLLPWLLLLPIWRSLADRPAAYSERMRWMERGVQQTVDWLRRVAARPGMRHLQVAGLVLAGVALMGPYLTRGIVGAGDAKWYANTVADYVVQMRAGIFPLWVGQGDYAFYGGIFPLRLAPYLAHLAAVVDLVTGRQLPPYAVINGVLVASLLGGLLAMYFCLRSICPARPWSAMGLALCYGLCPGALGLAYGQDLYMSFCTLPFLPVAFLGAVRSFTRDDLGPRLLMSGGVAAAWLAHPPIGMWTGLVIMVTQGARLLTRGSWRATWKYDAIAVGVLVLLAGYSVVSVRSLGVLWAVDAPPTNHYLFITRAFPGNWLPLDDAARGLKDMQLGYGLAALGVLVAAYARGSGGSPARWLLGCAAGLMLLLVPIPFLTLNLWRAMPQVVLNITNIWPMQRLTLVAAVCVVMAGALWLAGSRDRSRALGVFQLLLAVALVWGGLEATKFIRLANRITTGWADTARQFRPENRPMTFSAVGSHRIQPRYFNHGVTDYRLEHRFLSLDDREILRNATDAIIPGFGPGTAAGPGQLTRPLTSRPDTNPGIFNLAPRITLEPGKHYLLALEFLEHDYTGALLLEGEEFSRVYGLPEAGNERAFGANPKNARWLALWQTTGRPQEVRLRWLPAKPEAWAGDRTFARFEVREYDPAMLDVAVESLLPYRAVVTAPAASHVETPRLYFPGYQAAVDGRPVPVEMSPDGFVMVRVEPGRQVLELSYEAPLVARIAYYLGLAAWLGFTIVTVCYFWRERAQCRAS